MIEVYEAVKFSLDNAKENGYDLLKDHDDEYITNDLMDYDSAMAYFKPDEVRLAVERYRNEQQTKEIS
jgi:hypothetical protein